MNIKLIILLILGLYVLTGCTDANRAKWASIGGKHKITLYSGGVAVRTWHSSGYIQNEEKSDGYYFMDDSTGRLVTISGQVVIEQE
jgi:hypothetical protein